MGPLTHSEAIAELQACVEQLEQLLAEFDRPQVAPDDWGEGHGGRELKDAESDVREA